MFREISAWHLIIILVAFVVLFGYKKLPDATRSLGRSMRIFKSEIKGLHDDEPRPVESHSTAAPQAQTPVPQAQTPAPQAAPPVQQSAPPVQPAAYDARAEADRT